VSGQRAAESLGFLRGITNHIKEYFFFQGGSTGNGKLETGN